ncbi:MAG: UbiD family decarboxylase [Deltaproteobacteria bacterium]|nr:UbiD family decarboxylase [Deltaproteobacteria bacterium]
MAKDLRTFLATYEQDHPEDVIRIAKQIDSAHECTAIARHFERLNKFPLIVFENIVSASREKSAFPCVINVLGDRRKLAYAIGSTFEDVAIEWRRRTDMARIEPVVVPRSEAASKERVLLGDEVDLRKLPMLRHHEMDPGHYITAGMFTCYDPDSGIDNGTFHRGFVAGPREIRCLLTPFTHSAYNLKKHEERGRPMKVAYWVGHHPAFIMGCQTRMAYPESHYAAAGGVAEEPLRLVPSETLGDDFLVPADAEFVIEGIMQPGKRDLEGPFGEYPRYSGPQQMSPVFEVTAVTHRKDALWHSFMVGINNNYGGTQEEGTIYSVVKRLIPQVQRVYCPVSGSGRFHAYIQIRKTMEGQGKEVIMAALAASEMTKHVIVVDEDIDIYDERWVLWAVATRSQWDRDLVVVPGCRGAKLDPSIDGVTTTKGGIDATKPAPPTRFSEKLKVPDEVMKRIRLEEFIDKGRIAGAPTAVDR